MQAKLAIERARNSSLATESLCYDSGITRFAKELDSVVRAIWLALEERRKSNPSPSSSPFRKGRGRDRPPACKVGRQCFAHHLSNTAVAQNWASGVMAPFR